MAEKDPVLLNIPPSEEPERPASVPVVRPNTRSEYTPLWSGSRLPPLRRTLQDGAWIQYKRRGDADNNIGRRTRRRESETPFRSEYARSLDRGTVRRAPWRDLNAASTDEDEEEEVFASPRAESTERNNPLPSAPEEVVEMSSPDENARRRVKEQAEQEAKELEIRIAQEKAKMEMQLDYEMKRLQYLRERAGMPALPRDTRSEAVSGATSAPDSRPESAPPAGAVGGFTPVNPQQNLGAISKNPRLGFSALSTPSMANLTLINQNTRRLEQEAQEKLRQENEQARKTAELERIRRDFERHNEETYQKRLDQINADREAARRKLNEEMDKLQADQALSDAHREQVNRQVQRDLPLYSPAGEPRLDRVLPPQSITEPFESLSKAISNLNTLERDEEARVQDTARHLRDVTGARVELSLEASLRKFAAEQDAKYAAQMVAEKTRTMKETEAVMKKMEERLMKVEENERLSSRVNIEKKDACQPFMAHPSFDADDTAVQRANVAMGKIAFIANTTFPYRTDPFNNVLYICAESNKVAQIHRLSENQHHQLILDAIPAQTPYQEYLSQTETLKELFALASINAPSSMTRTEIELAINRWRLDGSSIPALSTSLIELHSLLDKNRDDYQQRKPNQPQLFKMMISRIMTTPDLPYYIRESLQTARMRIRPDDQLDDLQTTLNAACQRYVGYKPRHAQVKQSTAPKPQGPLAIEHKPGGAKITAGPPKAYPPQQNPPEPEEKKQGKGRGGKGRGKNSEAPTTVVGNSPDGAPARGRGRGRGRQRNWVRPWPQDRPYLSKNGNKISKEFEEWFAGFCSKCGHASHSASDCLLYPEKATILTCCSRCSQGLHEVCRSKRFDLQRDDAIVKRIENLYLETQLQRPPAQPIYYPYNAVPKEFAGAVAVPGQLPDDEE